LVHTDEENIGVDGINHAIMQSINCNQSACNHCNFSIISSLDGFAMNPAIEQKQISTDICDIGCVS